MSNTQQQHSAGGDGGEPFDDSYLIGNGPITAIDIRHDKMIHAITVYYGSARGPQHGEKGGKPTRFELRPGEGIVKITGFVDKNYAWNKPSIRTMQFHTNTGRSSDIYGRTGDGDSFKIDAGGTRKVQYISGRSDKLLERITCHFEEQPPKYDS